MKLLISSSSFSFASPMASSAPPPLPSLSLSTPIPVESESTVAPAFHVFLSCLNHSIRRPWSELADCSTSRSEFFSEATSHLRKNLIYFLVNYAVVINVVLFVSLVTNPFSLLLSTLVIFLTYVGSVVVSALVTGTDIVIVQGAFRISEDLFFDKQESGSATGMLSFLSRAASSVASTVISVHVCQTEMEVNDLGLPKFSLLDSDIRGLALPTPTVQSIQHPRIQLNFFRLLKLGFLDSFSSAYPYTKNST